MNEGLKVFVHSLGATLPKIVHEDHFCIGDFVFECYHHNDLILHLLLENLCRGGQTETRTTG